MIIRNNSQKYTVDSLDTFYNLMKDSPTPEITFKENISTWKQFFDNRYVIISQNILDNRLFEIIKFLLEQEQGKIFDYFQSDILDCLTSYQNQLYVSIKRQNLTSSEEISLLFKNINNYEDMCQFLEANIAIFNQDNITKNSIYKYRRTPITTNTVISLILTINENFFELSPEIVKKVTKFIEKKLITITPNEKIRDLLYEEMIYQYIDKTIPIKDFSGEELKDDEIIKAIITGQIPNIKIIRKLLDNLEPESILEIFNNDIFKILDFIENLKSIDKKQKQIIVNQIGDMLLTSEDFLYLLPLITNNCQNEYWKRYLTKDKFEKIINYTLGYDTKHLSFETINYLLDKEYINELFLSNLIETLKSAQKNFSEENQVILSTKVVEKLKKYNLLKEENNSLDNIDAFIYEQPLDLKTAIELIDNYLKGTQQLTINQTQAIIKSLIKNFTKAFDITDIEVYFVKHQKYNGSYITDSKDTSSQCININIDLLQKFLNQKKMALLERVQVLIVSLHEIRHAQKNKDKHSEIKDIETYEMLKEEVLRKYNPKYYTINYKNYQEEIDARIESYNMLAKFFETYLPNYLNNLQEAITILLQQEILTKEKRLQTNQINILNQEKVNFDLAFDTIIKYNPSILEEFPIFNLEYKKDGTPKSIEEISQNQTLQNQELITNILKIRYPETNASEIKSNHIR